MAGDWMSEVVKTHVYRDGGVWVTWRDGSTHWIGVVEKQGRHWVALAPRGGDIRFEAPTRREVIAWIKANPWKEN